MGASEREAGARKSKGWEQEGERGRGCDRENAGSLFLPLHHINLFSKKLESEVLMNLEKMRDCDNF